MKKRVTAFLLVAALAVCAPLSSTAGTQRPAPTREGMTNLERFEIATIAIIAAAAIARALAEAMRSMDTVTSR